MGRRFTECQTGNRPHMTPSSPALILFDRDDTLIEDRPALRDPREVRAMPSARSAVALARRAGVRLGVVSNQPVIADGSVRPSQLREVNRAVERMLGAFDVWAICPHAATDGCTCRKPQPGLVLEAAARLGVPVREVLVVGDVGSDVAAARAAGAGAMLVPTARTRQDEITDAGDAVAPDLLTAVQRALAGTWS
jgi:D-glycero-D-manno-heptose 1,7-bisphosphate phosphatase